MQSMPVIQAKIPFGKQPLRLSFVQCELVTSSAVTTALNVNSVAGLRAWIDSKPLTLSESTTLSLTAGKHALTIMVDLEKRGKKELRVTLRKQDAKVSWTIGK